MKNILKDFIIIILVILLTISVSIVIVKITKVEKITKKEIPISWEIKLKELIKSQIEYESNIIKDDKVTIPINDIEKHLNESIPNNPYELEIIVIDSPIVNAAAFPGGLIVVFSGLIKITDSPEELASVLAHELGHVINRDSLNSIIRQFGIAIVSSVITGGNADVLEKIIRNVVNNKFTREQEEKADDFALNLLIKSGISPQYFINVFEEIKKKEINIIDKDLMKYISTHPDTDSRIDKAKEKLKDFNKKEYNFNINWIKLKKQLPALF